MESLTDSVIVRAGDAGLTVAFFSVFGGSALLLTVLLSPLFPLIAQPSFGGEEEYLYALGTIIFAVDSAPHSKLRDRTRLNRGDLVRCTRAIMQDAGS